MKNVLVKNEHMEVFTYFASGARGEHNTRLFFKGLAKFSARYMSEPVMEREAIIVLERVVRGKLTPTNVLLKLSSNCVLVEPICEMYESARKEVIK